MANKKTTNTNVNNTKPLAQNSNTHTNSTPKPVSVPSATNSIKEIDPTQYITVLNGYQGGLTYKSSRTGEVFRWMEFGDEQEIELRELRNARNTQKKFFEKNWFMFSDEFAWVIDYLGVGRFYKNAISIDEFDDIFNKTPNELKKIIQGLSDGQKKAVAFRAQALVAEGEIDSNKLIHVLEETLGVTLNSRRD